MNVTWTFLFFFKQKTAYEMRISDWSSDVCSSDLTPFTCTLPPFIFSRPGLPMKASPRLFAAFAAIFAFLLPLAALAQERGLEIEIVGGKASALPNAVVPMRLEEHTSELQSLMRNSYAVFCLKTKNRHTETK